MNKIKKLLIIIIFSMVLCGCWDAIDIENRNIASCVFVDFQNGEYQFFVEMVEVSSQQNTPSTIPKGFYYSASGKTFPDTRAQLDRSTSKLLFLGACQVIGFTENISLHDIKEFIFRIRQIPEYRQTLYIVFIDNPLEEFVMADLGDVGLVGVYIDNLLTSLIEDKIYTGLLLADVLEANSSDYKGFLMPMFGLMNNKISLTGYVAFEDGLMQGKIPIEECDGLPFFISQSRGKSYVIPYQEVPVTIEINKLKRKVKSYYQDKVIFDINFIVKADIIYRDKSIMITDEVMASLQKNLQEIIKEEASCILDYSQTQIKSDFLRFYDLFRRDHPTLIKDLDWNAEYLKAQFNISVNIDMKTKGNIDFHRQGY